MAHKLGSYINKKDSIRFAKHSIIIFIFFFLKFQIVYSVYRKKMFQRKLFLLAIFSYMAIGQCAFKNNSLDCHRNILTEMDKHLRSMELVHGDQQFPESLEELKAHCG